MRLRAPPTLERFTNLRSVKVQPGARQTEAVPAVLPASVRTLTLDADELTESTCVPGPYSGVAGLHAACSGLLG